MTDDLSRSLAQALGLRPLAMTPMGGGCVGDVFKVTLADGRVVVAKVGDPDSGLDIEAAMLRHLARHSRLPVPEVLHGTPDLLVISYLDNDGRLTDSAQEHAGQLLAELHAVTAPRFGFHQDTLIGGLHQPNPWTASWLEFFREHRLMVMARNAVAAGRMPSDLLARVERLADRLDRWLEEPPAASLLHGDMWTGNVLCWQGRIAGFIDPAIYYGDPEIELAFSTLFGTFGERFFASYGERRTIRPGFFEERRDIYNLYPLLVHVRLFGGSYVGSVDRTLRQFGI